MIEILRITYYLYEFKRTKQGEVPIYCKLTTDGINRHANSLPGCISDLKFGTKTLNVSVEPRKMPY